MGRRAVTQWCHEILEMHLPKNGLYVDATMGNGHDTLFLCRLAGERGHVYAFDIQEAALENTRKRLEREGAEGVCSLIRASHVELGAYLAPGIVDGMIFNCGYLPGGDHSLATRPETTIKAIQVGLELLKTGGVMGICLYSGGDTGFEEKARVLSYLKGLDAHRYTVIVQEYHNRGNHPPTPVFIFREC